MDKLQLSEQSFCDFPKTTNILWYEPKLILLLKFIYLVNKINSLEISYVFSNKQKFFQIFSYQMDVTFLILKMKYHILDEKLLDIKSRFFL